VDGRSPFVIMIGDVEGIGPAPRATQHRNRIVAAQGRGKAAKPL
jgi:hypothetical protein